MDDTEPTVAGTCEAAAMTPCRSVCPDSTSSARKWSKPRVETGRRAALSRVQPPERGALSRVL